MLHPVSDGSDQVLTATGLERWQLIYDAFCARFGIYEALAFLCCLVEAADRVILCCCGGSHPMPRNVCAVRSNKYAGHSRVNSPDDGAFQFVF